MEISNFHSTLNCNAGLYGGREDLVEVGFLLWFMAAFGGNNECYVAYLRLDVMLTSPHFAGLRRNQH